MNTPSNITVIPADVCMDCLAEERGWTHWSTKVDTLCKYHYAEWAWHEQYRYYDMWEVVD